MARILIADHQACVRAFVSDELCAEGYAVETAADVESVRQHLGFSPPDLILLDLFLDGPDGLSLLHEFKHQYPGLPVIIFTAYDSYEEDPRISGADGYVIKSISLHGLKRKIAHHLGLRPIPNMVAGAQPAVRSLAGPHGTRRGWQGTASHEELKGATGLVKALQVLFAHVLSTGANG